MGTDKQWVTPFEQHGDLATWEAGRVMGCEHEYQPQGSGDYAACEHCGARCACRHCTPVGTGCEHPIESLFLDHVAEVECLLCGKPVCARDVLESAMHAAEKVHGGKVARWQGGKVDWANSDE